MSARVVVTPSPVARFSGMRLSLIILAVAAACGSPNVRVTTTPVRSQNIEDTRATRPPSCLATDFRSSIAWAPAPEAREIAGRVIATESGSALASAYVQLEPGGYKTTADEDGNFHLTGIPPARYRVRVQRLGYVTASDSITLGRDGIVMVAALSQPAREQECVSRFD